MQNSKSRFLHGSNGLPNKANKNQQRVAFLPEYWKTACQTVWGDGLRAGLEEFPFGFKSERESFISILNFYNFILASIPIFYLLIILILCIHLKISNLFYSSIFILIYYKKIISIL